MAKHTRGPGRWLNYREIGCRGNSHLPATDTEQEANHIGLLLLLEFFHVLEGTHLQTLDAYSGSIELNSTRTLPA